MLFCIIYPPIFFTTFPYGFTMIGRADIKIMFSNYKYRAFSLWPASLQIYWSKGERL